ncbi:hypothetical protein [Micromonospora tulbaghiae]|uniref:hypothetical protein n=1 Tax=Micromonospora tulbaghiae TaxID=479978 RepID=UPI003EBA00BF
MTSVSSFDFGLTGFVGWFHQDWRYEGSCFDLLGRLLGPETDPREVRALRSDAFLMRTTLTAADVELLWHVGSGYSFSFGPDGTWPSGPNWLATIVHECDDWLSRHGSVGAGRASAPHQSLADVVAREIEALTDGLPDARDPGGALRDALLRCNRSCSPDLALRWCLRIARNCTWPLRRSQYERLVALGDRFGYGEFVVTDAEYLTEYAPPA